ncbi:MULTISPECIES: hypothetical protein [Niallia]|uniref:Uncharacterized protein n=1 Tax=Niallia circulans TaxID=1397 RepID=A0A941JSP3_NIACI|nr:MULTISPECIES: hypothetical protein [Niallia]MCB5239633.1 hypothetical protein [Niallia circulans]MED3794312.1 hypothetical protein [Niallia alba]
MNELNIFGELHKYIIGLGPMKCTIAGRSLTLGYKPISFRGSSKKFATLYGERKYNCLIIHVDPGNPQSDKGRIIQMEIQEMLKFNIGQMRNFLLKKHEIYIPFEVIDSKERMELVKAFIVKQYKLFLENN